MDDSILAMDDNILANERQKKIKNTKTPILNLMKWGDFVLIAVVVIFCGLLWGKLILGFAQKGRVAEIVVKGEVVLRYDLETQKKLYEISDINKTLKSFTEEKHAIKSEITSGKTAFSSTASNEINTTSSTASGISANSNEINTTNKTASVIWANSEEIILKMSTQDINFAIIIKPGMIRFTHSDCPDQVCVQTGFISRPGQVAACIPAQVLVRITGEATNNDVDVIIK